MRSQRPWELLCLLAMMGCHHRPQRPAVVPGTRLGTPNFQGYCDVTGGGRALARTEWSCERGNIRVAIDANEACTKQFPDTHAHAEIDRVGDPFTWSCYAGRPGELGGINFDRYCRTTGALHAATDPHREWNCIQQGNVAALVDVDAACRFSYPQADGAHGQQLRPGNPTSWVCVRR